MLVDWWVVFLVGWLIFGLVGYWLVGGLLFSLVGWVLVGWLVSFFRRWVGSLFRLIGGFVDRLDA